MMKEEFEKMISECTADEFAAYAMIFAGEKERRLSIDFNNLKNELIDKITEWELSHGVMILIEDEDDFKLTQIIKEFAYVNDWDERFSDF